MSTEQDVQQIELSIEHAREMIKTGDALNRLMQNVDFKNVITEGYFKDEPARLVELKAAPAMSDEKYQNDIIRSIDGIGSLQQYFNTIWAMAANSERAIEAGEEELMAITVGDADS